MALSEGIAVSLDFLNIHKEMMPVITAVTSQLKSELKHSNDLQPLVVISPQMVKCTLGAKAPEASLVWDKRSSAQTNRNAFHLCP